MYKNLFSEEAAKVNFEPMANILRDTIDENLVYLFCLTRSGYPYLRQFEPVLRSKGIEPYSVLLKTSPDYAENGYKPVLGFVENPERFDESPAIDISELESKKSNIAIGFDDIVNLGRYAVGGTLYILSRARELDFSKYLLVTVTDESKLHKRIRISHISYTPDGRPVYGSSNSLINHIKKLAPKSSEEVDFSLIHPSLDAYESLEEKLGDGLPQTLPSLHYIFSRPPIRRVIRKQRTGIKIPKRGALL